MEIGEYIVAEAERQLNDPVNYLAAATQSLGNSDTIPAVNDVVVSPTPSAVPVPQAAQPPPVIPPPVPTPTPIPIPTPPMPAPLPPINLSSLSCNTPKKVAYPLVYSAIADFASSLRGAARFEGGEMYAPFIGSYYASPYDLRLVSFGGPVAPPRGIVELGLTHPINVPYFVSARDDIMAYTILNPYNNSVGQIVLRHSGQNHIFEATPPGDDVTRVLFTSIYTPYPIVVSGHLPAIGEDRVVFVVLAGPQQDAFVVQIKFPTGPSRAYVASAVPLSSVPNIPVNYEVNSLSVGAHSIGVLLSDRTRQGPSLAQLWNPGPDDDWNTTADNIYSLFAGGGGMASRGIAVAPDDHFIAAIEYYATLPTAGDALLVHNPGADSIPWNGDPGESTQRFSRSANAELYDFLEVSKSRNRGQYGTGYGLSFVSSGPTGSLRTVAHNFRTPGPDGSFGTADDRSQFVSDPEITASGLMFAEDGIFDYGMWLRYPSTRPFYAPPSLYAVKWCY